VRDEALATTPARAGGETAESPESGKTEVQEEISETDEASETSDVGETSNTAPAARTTLSHKTLGAIAGSVVLALGVLLLLTDARGASVAGTVVASALVGGAAGFLASRRR
jgi:hypothetical protein